MTFIEGVVHYDDKVSKARSFVTDSRIEACMKNNGVSKEELKSLIDKNDSKLMVLVLAIARFIMPGRVSCSSYAAVVSRLMDYVGVDGYRFIAGFCLPRDGVNYARDKEMFNKRRKVETHPVSATHVFVYYNNEYYEYFNGSVNNIDHIDCVDIETRIEFVPDK